MAAAGRRRRTLTWPGGWAWLVALATGAADLAMFWEPDLGASTALVLGLALVGYLPLAWRSQAPRVVFVIVAAQAAVAMLVVPGYVPTLGLLLALYTLALHHRRQSVVGLVATLVIFSKAVVEESQAAAPSDRVDALALTFMAYTLMALLAWGVGQLEWSRRNALVEATARRQAEARAAMAMERNRIAGELHDIVGHAVTIIVLHSAAARQQLIEAPALADDSLGHIEDASKQAMRELRGLLSVLRPDDTDADGRGAPGQQPPHGVGDIATVVEVMRMAGLTVDFEERGTPVPLDAETDLAAYRIVQESLTNVAKHVGVTAHATVVLDWRGSALVITVEDTGTGQKNANSVELSGGHGLLALRERVSAAHGEMTVTIDRRGGSQVEATLPITAAAR